MTIRQLPLNLVNQIKAGEVIDRPAGAVKELLENAIDAGATHIDIVIREGGKNLIRVIDNGCGMNASDVALSVKRHATSKLPDDDLHFISTMGFRGEALPSIGAIARLKIVSRTETCDTAHAITVDGGISGAVKPCAGEVGTTVEIRDMFFATPARLKFLRATRTESTAILDIVRRLCLAHSGIRFTLTDDGREKLDLLASEDSDAQLQRIDKVMGNSFAKNCMRIDFQKHSGDTRVHLKGFVSLPTLHHNTAVKQFMFVNGRSIRDKQILGAIRAGMNDVVPNGRHCYACLFIYTPPRFTDVNVHPSKAEVRFQDAGLVRSLIVSALREAVATHGQQTSGTLADTAVAMLQKNRHVPTGTNTLQEPQYAYTAPRPSQTMVQAVMDSYAPQGQSHTPMADLPAPANTDEHIVYPLGVAKTQLHKNYIISQTETGMIIVDAHAAHERIVYEKLKAAHTQKVAGQMLLEPELVTIGESEVVTIMAIADDLQHMGLRIDPFGDDTIAVRETPALLGNISADTLIRDIVGELMDTRTATDLQKRLDRVCATMACHNSVRSGRVLNTAEMDALLRQMEQTLNSGQCNHGRPTYLELSLQDIENLFNRS